MDQIVHFFFLFTVCFQITFRMKLVLVCLNKGMVNDLNKSQ